MPATVGSGSRPGLPARRGRSPWRPACQRAAVVALDEPARRGQTSRPRPQRSPALGHARRRRCCGVLPGPARRPTAAAASPVLHSAARSRTAAGTVRRAGRVPPAAAQRACSLGRLRSAASFRPVEDGGPARLSPPDRVPDSAPSGRAARGRRRLRRAAGPRNSPRLASAGRGVLHLLTQPVPRRQRVPGAGRPLDLGAGGVRRGGPVRRRRDRQPVPPLSSQGTPPGPAGSRGTLRPRAVLASQHRHHVDALVVVPHRDPAAGALVAARAMPVR